MNIRTLFLACAALCLIASAAQANPRRTPVVKAVDAVSPAVVNITVSKKVRGNRSPFGDPAMDQFFREFYGQQQLRVRKAFGSGVIINGAEALVVTNAHVVANGDSVLVRLMDGREFNAELLGADGDFDLAVLKLKEAQNLPEVALGDSDDIYIGETVIAIGNPFGYSHTVTTGVVSAINRSMGSKSRFFGSFIQTDAAINPGNSGGPLLNINGRLIGINTAILSKAEGIGFAIPANKIKLVVRELLDTGHVAPIWLGIFGQDIDPATARYFNLKNLDGMLVAETYDQTPAAEAGVKPGDIVLSFNGRKISDKTAYMANLFSVTKEERVDLVVQSGGKTRTFSFKPQPLDKEKALTLVRARWGFELEDRQQGPGAEVTRVVSGSPAARLGLRSGDIIHQIGGRRLNSGINLLNAFLRYRMQKTVLLRVQRGRNLYTARLTI